MKIGSMKVKNSKIYVAGHRGMVGSALVRRLQKAGYNNLLMRTRDELDLTNQLEVIKFISAEKPDYIFIAAAKVGGVQANNTYRAEFIYQNLMIQANIINAAWKSGTQQLLFLGSSCTYPRDCPQPIREDYLLSSPLEKTSEPYAIAKIAGIKLCESYNNQYGTCYIVAMPANLYGPNDSYDLNNSHVIPALIRKAHEAKLRKDQQLIVWGSGTVVREFLFVDDLAEACLLLMEQGIANGLFNIGSGKGVTIQELTQIVVEVVGFRGEIIFDKSKLEGTACKILDGEKMKNLGWQAVTSLHEGIRRTYQDFLTKIYTPTLLSIF